MIELIDFSRFIAAARKCKTTKQKNRMTVLVQDLYKADMIDAYTAGYAQGILSA